MQLYLLLGKFARLYNGKNHNIERYTGLRIALGWLIFCDSALSCGIPL
jgi:hypothetical protein